jgi:hypothetical protein
VFSNVLVGLALTNRPAVSGLRATFTEDNLHFKTFVMLKKLLEKFSERSIVSKEDKEMLSELYTEAPEDVQEEVKDDLNTVQEKPEQEEQEEAVEPAKEDEEKPKEEPKEEAEDAKLSEIVKKNETLEVQLSELLTEKRQREVSDCFSSLVVSNDNTIGFTAADQGEVVDFISTLTVEQRNAFSSLVKKVKNVDLTEHGTRQYADPSEDEMEMKAKKLAAKIQKDKKVPAHEALSEAYKQLKMTK